MTLQQQRTVNAIHKAKLNGMAAFQNWFNTASTVQKAVEQGIWDMDFYILTPQVHTLLGNLKDKVALEIGCGGGRLVNAACPLFQTVIGVDIHNEMDMVKTFLASQGKSNFKLHQTSGRLLPVDSGTVDFVYSFIVLQHLPSFSVLASYVKETFRCLKNGGVAQLYFGKTSKLNLPNRLRCYFKGYKEISDAPVNHTSLVVHTSKMKRLCENDGFRVVDSGVSLVRQERVPAGLTKKRGEQDYVTVVKSNV